MNLPPLDSPQVVTDALQKPAGEPGLFTLSLSDFKSVFREMQKQNGMTPIDIVLNGDWALVQFSELCNHRIRVVPDNCLRRLPRMLGIHLYIEEKDFEIAASVATFYGQREYLTFGRFIREELAVSGFGLLLCFVVLGAALASLLPSSNSTEILKSANEVLIGIAAVFFSIFMLFTASQNSSIIEDISLFKSGLIHRFIRVDKFVAWLAFIALGIPAINRVGVASLAPPSPPVAVGPTPIGLAYILPWTTAAAVTLMADSLLAVVRYYSERVRYVHETKLGRQLLDEIFEKRNTRK